MSQPSSRSTNGATAGPRRASRPPGVLFVDGLAQQTGPRTQSLHTGAVLRAGRVGARETRVVGSIPHPGARAPWDWWARYEAAINRVYEGFQCGDSAVRHADQPQVGAGRGDPNASLPRQRRAPRGQPHVRKAGDVLGPRRRASPDPLEQTPPTVESVDPSPAADRKPRATPLVSHTSSESTSTTSCWWSTKASRMEFAMGHGQSMPVCGRGQTGLW